MNILPGRLRPILEGNVIILKLRLSSVQSDFKMRDHLWQKTRQTLSTYW